MQTVHISPKKELGQHFLTDLRIAKRIADLLTGYGNYQKLIEVGPGTGALTNFLFSLPYQLHLAEIDDRSIAFLKASNPQIKLNFVGDFLKCNDTIFGHEQWGIIGNFPYNISSQILFKVLEYRQQIPEMVGMFQKEVAQRITQAAGDKSYGILSVLTQAYYKTEYVFTVQEGSFNPPPKVKSGVIRLQRLEQEPPCNQKLFWLVVKTAFNQRRKMLSNSLKPLLNGNNFPIMSMANERPEQLPVTSFIELTNAIEAQYRK